MKSLILLLVAVTPMVADQASKNAKIEEMLTITHVDRVMAQMLDQMKRSVTTQVAKMDIPENSKASAVEMQRKMIDLIADRMSWDRAKPKFVQLYDETFTEADIDGILAFYKSPAGQRMLEKMPELMQKSMAVGQELVGNIAPEIQRMMEGMRNGAVKK